jgi:hypothetical protein
MFSGASQSGDCSPQSKAYGEKKKAAMTAAFPADFPKPTVISSW